MVQISTGDSSQEHSENNVLVQPSVQPSQNLHAVHDSKHAPAIQRMVAEPTSDHAPAIQRMATELTSDHAPAIQRMVMELTSEESIPSNMTKCCKTLHAAASLKSAQLPVSIHLDFWYLCSISDGIPVLEEHAQA